MKNKYCAFFDLDGTLINTRSMLSFVDYLYANNRDAVYEFDRYYKHLHVMFYEGAHRQEINRYYYRFLAGLKVDDVECLGAKWFSSVKDCAGIYNTAMLDKLNYHLTMGAMIVFVTGSFLQIIQPLMSMLGVKTALCTNLDVRDGVFTGKIRGEPCIGEGKLNAIKYFAMSNNVDLKRCVAFGDDETDLPMLNAVGDGRLIQPEQLYVDQYNEILNRGKLYV